MYRIALALPAASLLLASTAFADPIGVEFTGSWPWDCALEIRFVDGDTGEIGTCIVDRSDVRGNEAECGVNNIGHLGDPDTFVRVLLTAGFHGDQDACVADGGLAITTIWGDGSGSSNFEVKRWTSDGSSGVEHALDHWGDGSSGTSEVIELGVVDGGEAEYLRGFRSAVRKSSKSNSTTRNMEDVWTETPDFCAHYEGDEVVLKSRYDRYVSIGDPSQPDQVGSIGADETFEVVCNDQGRAQFRTGGATFRILDDRTVAHTTNLTASRSFFDLEMQPGGRWAIQSREDDTYLRARGARKSYRVDASNNLGTSERFLILRQ